MQTKLETPITVTIKVVGPKDFREIDVILDTGARFTALSWEVLKDIGYDPASSQKRITIVTANGVIESPLIVIKEINLEGEKVLSSPVAALDIPELTGVEGLLGLTFLEKMITTIDYKKNILEIVDP